jgi:hypothetical protein
MGKDKFVIGYVSGVAFKKEDWFLRPPSPISSPLGEDIPADDFGFADDCPANPIARIFERRRKILLLPGEKAGMREDVAPT